MANAHLQDERIRRLWGKGSTADAGRDRRGAGHELENSHWIHYHRCINLSFFFFLNQKTRQSIKVLQVYSVERPDEITAGNNRVASARPHQSLPFFPPSFSPPLLSSSPLFLTFSLPHSLLSPPPPQSSTWYTSSSSPCLPRVRR